MVTAVWQCFSQPRETEPAVSIQSGSLSQLREKRLPFFTLKEDVKLCEKVSDIGRWVREAHYWPTNAEVSR